MDTTNLVGRPVTADDLEFIERVWNDELVAPTVGGLRTERQLRERVSGWTDHWGVHGFGETLFAERATGLAVGWGGLQCSTIGVGECLTVGYVIRPDAWGRGYATEIAVASVEHAWNELRVNRVFASVAATNAASRRVLEKSGFTLHREVDHRGLIEVVYVIDHPHPCG